MADQEQRTEDVDVHVQPTGQDSVEETQPDGGSSDLFASAFGSMENKKDDDTDDEDAGMHAKGCNTSSRMATPPLPDTRFAPVTKKNNINTGGNLDTKEDGRKLLGPDVDRDLSMSLRNHFRFHDRVLHFIPRLHAPDFDWSRRYWIAVLMLSKKAKNATSEKDFVWMKGNRLSTGKTIWHKYMETDFSAEASPDKTILMIGNERLQDTDTMEEVDFFADRFVLLRAVNKGTPEAETKSRIEGLVPEAAWPAEVVELD